MFPSLQTVIAVSLAGFALSATPGPSMLYVLSRTVGQGRWAGYASALGLCFGGALLAIATALGLATLFAHVTWLVPTLRYLGSAYLIWLGIGMIREAREQAATELKASSVGHSPMQTIFWQGTLVELLNPKTVLFFALFLPPFVANEAAAGMDVTLNLLLLGILVPLTAVPADLIVATVGGAMAQTLNDNRRAREILGWVGGSILILIALRLLWSTL
ncbi:LysE family translocator [Gemmobacter denitrificans]|uniref:LysE family translocator n=1 Tax=Gemmobacter denitrificans TaxID=3123040 RepID=A0ABU8BXC4_9RHOB